MFQQSLAPFDSLECLDKKNAISDSELSWSSPIYIDLTLRAMD